MPGKTNALLASVVAACLLAAPAAAQQFSDGYSFLKAVKERDGSKVQSILSEPGSVVINTRERTSGEGAIHVVTKGRDITWLGFLIGKGARVDLQDHDGNTALIFAAQIGWTEGAALLLTRRASVDLANSRGETPLILAVQRRDAPMVRLLLDRGANPKRADTAAGYSAIDYARRDNRSDAILKMLETPVAKAKPMQGPKL